MNAELDRYLDALHDALARMPDGPPKQVVTATLYRDQRPSQIARRMGISVHRVYGLRREALRMMRRMAAEILANEGG